MTHLKVNNTRIDFTTVACGQAKPLHVTDFSYKRGVSM